MGGETGKIGRLRYRYAVLSLLVAVVTFISSCNPAKRVTQGQYLLAHNGFIYRPLEPPKNNKNSIINNKITAIPGSEIAKLVLPPELSVNELIAYIKQKPNTKILGLFPLHLYEYNMPDPEKTKERRVLKNKRIDEKNTKIEEENKVREAKGKKLKSYKSKDPKAFSGEWMMNVGEPPVILDSTLMSGSVEQLTKFLHTKGYFDGRVSDSVHFEGKKAYVFYIIKAGKPYKVINVKYQLDDSALAPIVYKDSVNSLINYGSTYDEDILKKERDRLTRMLKDEGYYAFAKEYVDYEIDTNRATKEVSITIGVKKYAYIDPQKPDSVIETDHHQYFINNITIQMGYNPNMPVYEVADTVRDKDYYLVSPKNGMVFLPKILLTKIHMRPHEMFRVTNLDNTYAGLTQMKEFRYINIRWVILDSNKLDCYIQLMPSTKQSFNVEAVGDNTGGNWGAQADGSYQNINLFKGAEVLQVKLKYSIQAEPLLATEAQNSEVAKSLTFNTQDIGPEATLAVPRPLNIFKLVPINPAIADPQTAFKLSYDFQERPDYQRNILTLAYGYDFNCWKHDHITITLFELSYVNALDSNEFLNALRATNDYFLIYSFTTHAITDFRVSWTFNNQNLTKLKNFDYVKLSLETSGFIPHYVDGIIGASDKIDGIAYSHYVKGDADYRHYFVLSKDDKLAVRGLIGVGVPMFNNAGEELPFDKSYWVGGSNDIRAWAARTLGPGGNTQLVNAEQIGDIKLEANAEYRLNVIKFFGLAFFFDAGNVWLLNKNPGIPHGEIEFNGPYAFWHQVALGAGTGFRFDFTYVVLRLDLAWPLLDPSAPPENLEQIHHTLKLDRMAPNIGIGFPF